MPETGSKIEKLKHLLEIIRKCSKNEGEYPSKGLKAKETPSEGLKAKETGWKQKYFLLRDQFEKKIDEWKDFKRNYEKAIARQKNEIFTKAKKLKQNEFSSQDSNETLCVDVYDKEITDTYTNLELEQIIELNKKEFVSKKVNFIYNF